jgi:hypothetical protein
MDISKISEDFRISRGFPKKRMILANSGFLGFWHLMLSLNKAREDSVLTKAFADHRHKHVKNVKGPKHRVKWSAEEYNRDCFRFDPLSK